MSIDAAMAFLRERLPADGEWHAARPLLDQARDLGITESAVARARGRLDVETQRAPQMHAPSHWRRQTRDTNAPRDDHDEAWAEIEATANELRQREADIAAREAALGTTNSPSLNCRCARPLAGPDGCTKCGRTIRETQETSTPVNTSHVRSRAA